MITIGHTFVGHKLWKGGEGLGGGGGGEER